MSFFAYGDVIRENKLHGITIVRVIIVVSSFQLLCSEAAGFLLHLLIALHNMNG